MLKAAGLSLALALIATTGAYAKDDDDAKVPAAEVEKVEATLSTLGCKGYEGLKKEEQGIYEIDDAKCAMGTVDIKLDKDYTVILISRYYPTHACRTARRSDVTTKRRAGWSGLLFAHLVRENTDDPFAERCHPALGCGHARRRRSYQASAIERCRGAGRRL